MLKEFLLKKMMKSRLGNIPEAEQDKLIKLVSENPALFQKIALEAQEKMKSGKDQMSAVMEVFAKYKTDLERILGK